MKTARLLCLVLPLALAGCPHTGPGPAAPIAKDPYAIARATIQGAQLSILVADGIFEIWAGGAELIKAAAARAQYTKVRAAVVASLKVALDAVNIAEEQKAGFDLAKLLGQANTAWKDLQSLLTSLGIGASPASAPTASGTPAPKTYTAPTIQDLPATLLRSK